MARNRAENGMWCVIKTAKNLLNTGRGIVAAGLAAVAVLAGLGAAQAQDDSVPAVDTTDPFNLPESITLLGQGRP